MVSMNKTPDPHGRRYPWEEWFAQREIILYRGRDFEIEPWAMAQMAARTAKRLKITRTIRVKGHTVEIGPKDLRFVRKRRAGARRT